MSTTDPPRLGKYELVARIATGGMAEIFLARQPGPGSFSRLVVVKRILPHLAERPQFVEMFLEEARLASLIHHQNVVQIFDVGQHGDAFFIAMEYIEGLSVGALSRRARKQRALLPVAVAGEIIAQACDGLHVAHELRDEEGHLLGLVHRDVSPHNLMLARTGVVKLVDFGIAKARGSDVRTRTGAVKGKFPYMSPEQCRGEPLDRRSDLFSLASVFAEILVGERIFDRPTDLATLKAVTEEPLPVVSEMSPEVPAAVSDVILKAHSRDPAERYATAEVMAAAIREAVGQTGEEASPEVLARYLETDCAELLEARASSLTRLKEITHSTSVPRLEGFDEVTEASGSVVTRPDRHVKDDGGGGATSRSRTLAVAAAAIVLLAAIGGGLYFWLVMPHRPSGPPLRFACPPYYPAETVEEGLLPLAEYLEKRLDRRVDVVVPADYDTTIADIINGRADFANVSPVLLVKLQRLEPEIEIIASHQYEGARSYQSILVARDDAGIASVEDLRGKAFCYVDRSSTSGFLMPRHFLRQRGLDPEGLFSKTRLSGTHVEVMQDIVAGRCDAGAIFSGALLSAQELDVPTSRLQIVANAGQTPWDVLVASPDLDDDVQAELRQALLDFDPERDLGRSFVSTTFRIDGFLEPEPEEFEAIAAAADAEGLLPTAPAPGEASPTDG